ncbi:hypothetical protein [Halobellus limi]|uniref:Uncharacterized protein n=1 Tax=Halobellus limi TaxID=699433 RepID=A0A1H5ZUQ8_9EURY|nr:hypothetical protein [Halobellus limi]QCC47934.1 hypothetical protein DV707_09830 [Halobellus limi]SEG39892.1 hypothetical protein SAMN04488133_2188 [Halobellus limi]
MDLRGRSIGVGLLIVALGQLSVRAVLGGSALLLDPSGSVVGLSVGTLSGTPFRSFLVPGALLLVVFGLVPAAVAAALYEGQRWGRPAAVTVAVALVGWVAVEVAVGFDRPTAYLNLATAAALVALSVYARRPGTRVERPE